jgi:hypothetical protein
MAATPEIPMTPMSTQYGDDNNPFEILMQYGLKKKTIDNLVLECNALSLPIVSDPSARNILKKCIDFYLTKCGRLHGSLTDEDVKPLKREYVASLHSVNDTCTQKSRSTILEYYMFMSRSSKDIPEEFMVDWFDFLDKPSHGAIYAVKAIFLPMLIKKIEELEDELAKTYEELVMERRQNSAARGILSKGASGGVQKNVRRSKRLAKAKAPKESCSRCSPHHTQVRRNEDNQQSGSRGYQRTVKKRNR